MGNDRRPSRDRKGPHRSPRTSPKKGSFGPHAPNARRTDSSHEHSQDSRERTTIPSDDGSDIYDEEGFSRTEIAMAMSGEQIYLHGSAIHSTLQHRLSEENHSNLDQDLSQHLDHSRWTTPPLVPTFSTSPLIPVSPQFETNRIWYLERILKNLSVAQLVKYDKEFCDLMWNLEGIQEWVSQTSCRVVSPSSCNVMGERIFNIIEHCMYIADLYILVDRKSGGMD